MGGFIKDKGLSDLLQLLEQIPSLFRFMRKKAFEKKGIGWKAGDAEGSDDGRGTGDRDNGDLVFNGGLNQPEPGSEMPGVPASETRAME